MRHTHARDTGPRLSPVAPPGLYERLSATPARQGAGTDDVPGGLLSLGPGWHGVFFVQDDALCLVLAAGPPPWGCHLGASAVRRCDHPPGPAGGHAAPAVSVNK